jgi:DNA-binding transcriptional MocR family regulator
MPKTTNQDYLYRQLEQQLREEIHSGQRAAGDRLPSVRKLCSEQKISKSTVLTAYSRLEAEGLIEARPRSGYFVSAPQGHNPSGLNPPAPSAPEPSPAPVSVDQILLDIMAKGAAFELLPGAGPELGNEQLRRCLARAQRRQSSSEQDYYDEPQGCEALRRQLAQRMALAGSQVAAADLLVTAGCQHALLLALMATTQPGDVVAIESPGFYGAFQLLEMLGLKALELPSSVTEGISPEALELALQHWPVRALWVSPCHATPTGSVMPEANKQQVLALAKAHDFAIIEDDIYGELQFGSLRPRSLYSYDQTGSVLLCSSFSKSLSRDLRLGWIAPGKYMAKVQRLKLVTALACSQTLQRGVSEFLAEGGYDRHLRHRRLQLSQQYQALLSMIPEYLPMAVSCSQPRGGPVLWLELPEKVSTTALYTSLCGEGITPGRLFTAQQRYENFLRLSFSHPWTEGRVAALERLGHSISRILK